jgi:hypothetical protein
MRHMAVSHKDVVYEKAYYVLTIDFTFKARMFPSACKSQENTSFYFLLIFSIKGGDELWACLYYSPNFNNMQTHRTLNEYNLRKNPLHSFPLAYETVICCIHIGPFESVRH